MTPAERFPNDPPKCPNCGANTSSEGQLCNNCKKR